MRIKHGDQLIRVQLLHNANFGAASGQVTLDRPTQVDSCHGLPFIPNSALRGVMRNIWELRETAPIATEIVFGDPAEPHPESTSTAGGETRQPPRREPRPGNLVVGNGDLLTFPVLAEDGRRCWVFPSHQICKSLTLQALCDGELDADIRRLVGTIAGGSTRNLLHKVLAIPALPILNTPFHLQQVTPSLFDNEIQVLRTMIKRWCGDWLPANEPALVVNEVTVRALWQHGAEIRDLTALSREGKSARPQSLRRVETVPEGSIFLSLFTWLESADLEFPANDAIQVGANEGQALGFCRLAAIDPNGSAVDVPALAIDPASPEMSRYQPDRGMTEMHAMITDFARANSDRKLRKKLRSAITDFGWRFSKEGPEATLAFALARARPSATVDKLADATVYRWLLNTVLGGEGSLEKYKGQTWFSVQLSHSEKRQIMARWLWLRKYGDLELQTSSDQEESWQN